VGRLPTVRQQFLQLLDRMRRQTRQHVTQVGERVDPQQL
jgi:hypothetical protein